MALTIYPNTNYDSFVTVADANALISLNEVDTTKWDALTDEKKEVYLRLALRRIFDVISTDTSNADGYLIETDDDAINTYLPLVASLMASHDIKYSLSTSINPNTVLVTKEKVGDIEVQYQHKSGVNGIETSYYPKGVRTLLAKYGAIFNSVNQAKLVR